MTSVSPWTVDSATATTNRLMSGATTSKAGQNNLNQSDYLKLMTAQLKYQDPFEPMDNSQMVAQMAQFSQISAQTEANSKLDTIAAALSGSRLADAANWIGKSMLVESSTAAPNAAGHYAGQVAITADSPALTVDLVDSAGATVRRIDLGAQKAGVVAFDWDGRTDDGTVAASGPLTIRATGGKVAGTASWATIAAVQSPASGADAKLITPLGAFTTADALSLG
ncbi:MAG: flagellar hook capping FlgD N-terminal domain-containing protein [Sphingobium sp.]